MKLRSFILSILLGVSAFAFADNETQTVKQVTAPVTLGGSVDYHISSALRLQQRVVLILPIQRRRLSSLMPSFLVRQRTISVRLLLMVRKL